MDLARGVILLTGVFFHAAFIFSNPGWMVVSPWHSGILAGFVEFVRGYRMETLFVVSGFFSAVLVTRKGSKGFVLNRMVRMGVPLLFCGMIFNGAAILLQDHPIVPWRSSEYFSSGTWMLHLWNMGNLLVYEALMFSLLRLRPRTHQDLAQVHLPVWLVLGLYGAAVASLNWIWYRSPSLPWSGFFIQQSSLALYAPAYLLGYTIHQNKSLRDRLFDLRLALPLAGGLFVLAQVVAHLRPEWSETRPLRLLANFEHIGWAMVLFSLVKAFETRNLWVRRLSIASYSIYILHLPLQVALFRFLPGMREGWTSFLFLSLVPIAVVWTFHVLVIERWKVAGFLINGKVYDDKTRSF